MSTDFPIIAKLGGRKRVREHLARLGKERSHKALTQWTFRRRIPGDIQTALMQAAKEAGVDVDYTDFRRPEAPCSEAA